MRSDLDALGIALPERYLEPQRVIIWPQHAEAWNVFTQCSGQWRYLPAFGSKPVAQGIDRTALASVMQMLGIENQSAVLLQVQHIEAGALEAWRQR